MNQRSTSGRRIRDRRIELGFRQSALAQTVGISASYLNLIEHDRRRIGGKLVIELARALEIEPSHFSETARSDLVEQVRRSVAGQAKALEDSADTLANRMPEWAEYVVGQEQRLQAQTQLVAALTDRLAHDPQLAASVHEVLSVITSIRSTAGILAGDEKVEDEWLTRFHRNIYEDSRRLASAAQALVAYLEEAESETANTDAPLAVEELGRWLAARDFHLPELENAGTDAPAPVWAEPVTGAVPGLPEMAEAYFRQYRRDAGALPLDRLRSFMTRRPFPDPLDLSSELSVDFATLLRRIAALPKGEGPECGLVVCDNSGTITFRRPIDGFPVPRFGAGCPLWPLFQSFSQIGQPIRDVVQHPGYGAPRFVVFAVSSPKLAWNYRGVQVYEATMLILPANIFGSLADDAEALPVGAGCRACPRRDCAARREPPIGGFRS